MANPLSMFTRFKGAGKELWDKLRVGMAQRSLNAGIFDSMDIPIVDFFSAENQLSALTGKVWAAYKAGDLISGVATTTDWNLQTNDSFEAVKNEKILALIRRPNPTDTFEDMMRRWVFHITFTGKAFWLKDQTNALGQPKAMYSLNPKRVRIYTDETLGIVGYGYQVNGIEIPFEVGDVIYWRLAHPDEDFEGLGKVEGGAKLFSRFAMLDEYQQQYVKRGGRPSALLIHKEKVQDEAAWKKVKIAWEKEHGGSSNSGKMGWLSGEWTYQQLGLSMADMQSIETMKQTQQEIFSLLGIPLGLAGMKANESYASAQIEDVQFRRYTILPLLNLFASKFTPELVKKFDKNLWFVFMLGGLAYMREIIADYKELLANGAMTPNEFREVAGLDPVDADGMDDFYLSSSLIPMAAAALMQAGQAGQTGRDNQTRANNPIDQALPRKAADIIEAFKSGKPIQPAKQGAIARKKRSTKNLWDAKLRKFGATMLIGRPEGLL